MGLQSVVFNRNYFTLAEAKHWMRKHDFPIYKVHTTPNTYRFRQEPPNRYRRYYSKEITYGVTLVFQE